MNLIKSRALQYVRRLNFERCNRYQSVAEHSFYVALLALEIAEIVGFKDRLSVLEAALLHDIPEAVTGDIPFLVRRALDPVALANLDALAEKEIGVDLGCQREVLEIVSYADALEFALYLKEERESGNVTLVDIEKETLGRLKRTKSGNSIDDAWGWAPEWVYAAELLGIDEDVAVKRMPNGIKH